MPATAGQKRGSSLMRLTFCRRLLSGVLLATLSCGGIAAAVAPPETPSPEASARDAVTRATLANGMHVILVPSKLAPVVTVLVAYGVGDNDDTMPGIAHATEHMLFRGTTTLSGGQLSDIAARMGAQYNAFTGGQSTIFYYKMPSAYTGIVLHIEADRMVNATIRDADWATERGAIEQEIRARDSSPPAKIGNKLRETFFAGTPFAADSGGTIPSFEKMTAADIRGFYHAWYKPQIATLIVSGDFDPAATLAAIHQEFDPIPAGTVPERKPIVVPPLTASQTETTIDFPVGFGVLGYRLPGANDPDYATSLVLASVLESKRGALADLSAHGKVLVALSVASNFPEVGADFLIAIPPAGGTPQQAQDALSGVIDGYRSGGVPADLVDSAKNRLLSEQVYGKSSISGLAIAWAENVALGTTPDASDEAISKVTNDDVNRVLRQYFTPEHRLAITVVAKPTGAVTKVDPSAATEHLGYVPTVHEPLPAWAVAGLKAPLRPPSAEVSLIKEFPNGLRLLIKRESVASSVYLSGVVRSDPQLYEPPGKDGVNLLVTELLPWGSASYDRTAYQAALDAIAGTTELGTSFTLQVQSKDFERGLELLADGLLHPAFPPAGFAVVKTQISQNVALANALPKEKAERAQRLALYPPGDPRRRDITERTIAANSLSDVKRYYRATYRPDQTTIAIVGDVAPDVAVSLVRKYFGTWANVGPEPAYRYPAVPARAHTGKTVVVKSDTTADSDVTLKQLFAMTRNDPDFIPLLLANTILSGESTGSMLFEEMRTHLGLVYDVSSDFAVNDQGAEFSISYSSDPKNVQRANASAIAVIKRLQTTPLPLVELQRAKALLIAQRVLPLDSYEGVATSLIAGAKEGYINTGSDEAFWKKIVATTPAQVQHAMRRIDANYFVKSVVQP